MTASRCRNRCPNRMRPVLRLWLFVSLCSGCRCGPGVQAVTPARLVVTPEAVVLGPVYVGQVAAAEVSVANEGGATAEP